LERSKVGPWVVFWFPVTAFVQRATGDTQAYVIPMSMSCTVLGTATSAIGQDARRWWLLELFAWKTDESRSVAIHVHKRWLVRHLIRYSYFALAFCRGASVAAPRGQGVSWPPMLEVGSRLHLWSPIIH